jgi:hypothetical protein
MLVRVMGGKRRETAGKKAATVRLPDELWAAVKIRAIEERRDLADLIVEALRDYMAKPTKKKSR